MGFRNLNTKKINNKIIYFNQDQLRGSLNNNKLLHNKMLNKKIRIYKA